MKKDNYSFNSLWGNIVTGFDKGVYESFELYNGDESFYFQYIKRDIADEIPTLERNSYFDIITPFDYGGFYYTSEEILEKGLLAFEQRCKEDGIVSAFLRFNPMLEQNYQIIKKYMECIKLQEHIVIDLQNDYRKNFSKRKIRNIQKAKKQKYKFIIDDNIDNFYSVYIDSMDRLDADKYFKFDKKVLEKLCDFGQIFSIYYDNKAVSSLFIIEDENEVYYFLGGTLSKYLSFGFNSLLFELVCDFYKAKKTLFFLGGGKDGLYQYKCEFSQTTRPFYIGKKVFDKEIYDRLTLQTKQQNNNFFPQYRKKTI